ncbi:heparinase II/III domain-containing protein [Paenibacillus contaminans]|uniref:heparinase II/III domain-containing protein n=1 Tax=Paenibacillus contaminans TaxID=450362 RepID=UPI00131501FA|nr:heparinase II/III family protein [Paenibacillus contaminans]
MCKKEIDRFGNYPWKGDPLEQPWKLTCPSCQSIFPSNDFGSYYKSGIDENGFFNPEAADRSLLKNTLYPDKDENWCVDDGYGWLDPEQNNRETRRYTFIAYYNHWLLWYSGAVEKALNAFSEAYLYTNNPRYAAAGIILLDRIADVYPDMDSSVYLWEDGFRNSHGLTGLGKVIGCIWETMLVKSFTLAYDALFPGTDIPDVLSFLSRKAQMYQMANKKESAAAIRHNIEQGIVMQIKPGIESGQISGNVGMHQSALAAAAVVLDNAKLTNDWVPYMFKTHPGHPGRGKGNIMKILVNDVDRDGHGTEASPGYNHIWLSQLKLVADVLSGQGTSAAFDLYAYPKFRKLFHMPFPYVLLESYTPSIGDTKRAGDPGLVGAIQTYVSGFANTGDPLLAQYAYLLNGNKWDNLSGDMFSDNEKIVEGMKKAIDEFGPFHSGSTNVTGYGFTGLRDGKGDSARALTLYYGRNTGHGHRDTLNLGLYAFGLDLSPDHGYPSFADGNYERVHWTNNTVSHNTVVVNRSTQADQVVGIPHHYANDVRVKLIDVEAPKVYPETQMYRRTVAMIKIDETDSYYIDFFRVKGGEEHHYSFHGGEGEVATEGLNFIKQASGTYAGENVPVADKGYDEVSESGFNYLYHVERANLPQGSFSLDWSIKDTWKVKPVEEDIHLRITMLSDVHEVSLADGQPPQNKPGNPKSYKYVLAHRKGNNLESQFVSVMEAYKETRKVQSISAVPVKADGKIVQSTDVFAVKVMFVNGRTDIIVNALNPDVVYTIEDHIRFQGFFGVCSLAAERPVYGYVCNGTLLQAGEKVMIREASGNVSGSVVGFTKDMSAENQITVRLNGVTNADTLAGKYVYIQNDGIRNAAYEIKDVKVDAGTDNGFVLNIGDITLIRSWVDEFDFSRGYVYDVHEGDSLSIPLCYEWGTLNS